MPNTTIFDRGDVVLATLPFSDLSGMQKRPAVIVSVAHASVGCLLLPITSQVGNHQPGEFVLADWKGAGPLYPSVVKRGLFTLDQSCISRRLGRLTPIDPEKMDGALRLWLGL